MYFMDMHANMFNNCENYLFAINDVNWESHQEAFVRNNISHEYID